MDSSLMSIDGSSYILEVAHVNAQENAQLNAQTPAPVLEPFIPTPSFYRCARRPCSAAPPPASALGKQSVSTSRFPPSALKPATPSPPLASALGKRKYPSLFQDQPAPAAKRQLQSILKISTPAPAPASALPAPPPTSALGKRKYPSLFQEQPASVAQLPRLKLSLRSLKERMNQYDTKANSSPLRYPSLSGRGCDLRADHGRRDTLAAAQQPSEPMIRRIGGYFVNVYEGAWGVLHSLWILITRQLPAAQQEIVALETDGTGAKRRAVAGRMIKSPRQKPEPIIDELPGSFPQPAIDITPPESQSPASSAGEFDTSVSSHSDLTAPSNPQQQAALPSAPSAESTPPDAAVVQAVLPSREPARSQAPSAAATASCRVIWEDPRTSAGTAEQAPPAPSTSQAVLPSREPARSQAPSAPATASCRVIWEDPRTAAEKVDGVLPTIPSRGAERQQALAALSPAMRRKVLWHENHKWVGHPIFQRGRELLLAQRQKQQTPPHSQSPVQTPRLPSDAKPAKETDPQKLREKAEEKDQQVSDLVDRAKKAQIGSPEVQELRESYRRKKDYDEQLADLKRKVEIAREDLRKSDEAKAQAQLEREAEEASIAAEKQAAAQQEHARKQPLLRPLDPEWAAKVDKAMETKDKGKALVSSADGVELKRSDFGRVLPTTEQDRDGGPRGWLNDEIVNAWFAAIVAQKKEQTGYRKGGSSVPAYEAYNTGWYSSYKKKDRGIDALRTWSKRKGLKDGKLLQAEKVFFPINGGAHWSLLIVSPKERKLEFLDSLNGKGKKWFDIAREWLRMELGALYVPEEWEEAGTRSGKQDNMSDCGVFACVNGLASAKGADFGLVRAETMPLARRLMVAVLLNGGFTGDFEL